MSYKYSSEVVHNGKRYHVQTQDKGPISHCVESIVYNDGRVLACRKSFYTAFLESKDLREKISKIIEEQHGTIVREINEGKYEHL